MKLYKIAAIPAIALAAGLGLAACGAQPPVSPAPSDIGARGGIATSAPASTAPAAAAAALTGDQRACQALETHPLPHTQQQINDYMSFLSRESLVATSPALQTAIMNTNVGHPRGDGRDGQRGAG